MQFNQAAELQELNYGLNTLKNAGHYVSNHAVELASIATVPVATYLSFNPTGLQQLSFKSKFSHGFHKFEHGVSTAAHKAGHVAVKAGHYVYNHRDQIAEGAKETYAVGKTGYDTYKEIHGLVLLWSIKFVKLTTTLLTC